MVTNIFFHTELNSFPEETISHGSKKMTWWKCAEGHEWEMTPKRAYQLKACIFCSNSKVLQGFNDLATTHPEIAAEWHPTKNFPNTSASFTHGSQQSAWWKCPEGHDWETLIRSRTAHDITCVYCSGQRVLTGYNDLTVTHPELSAIWDGKRNTVHMNEISPFSYRKPVYWMCEEGHQWLLTVPSQIKRKQKCLICFQQNRAPSQKTPTKKKLVPFAEKYPELLSQWSEENIGLDPAMLSAGSSVNIIWKCVEGHTWKASLKNRTQGAKITGCQICYMKQNSLQAKYPAVLQKWNYAKNVSLSPEMVSYSSAKRAWWKCDRGHEWESAIYSQLNTEGNRGCPYCVHQISSPEIKIVEWLDSLTPNLIYETSNREVLKGQELDIYLPEKKIAIEFNGLYWHSEDKGKDSTYHYEKWKRCQEAGIQLIQVWEDDWQSHPQIIKNMLAHKIGLNKQEKIYARRTTIVHVTSAEAREFLEQNHIQGYANGSQYIALRYENIIVALLVLKKEPNTAGKTLKIVRYATSAAVTGGFSKLLHYVEKVCQPSKIVTFSDHCISDGGLYANNGFIADKEVPSDYMYVVKGRRSHKFNYRLARFRKDAALIYKPNLTEQKLAILNKIPRIWDAGKTRWVKTCTPTVSNH